MELFCGCGDEHDEQNQQEGLRDFEWRLGAGGREGVEGGDVLEGLGDEDEDVEVERDHGGDGVGAAPSCSEVEDVEGGEGDSEDDHREDAEDDAWSHFVVGKGEAGEAGQDGGDEKHNVPGGEEPAVDKAEEDDEAGSDADEADDDVQGGEGA